MEISILRRPAYRGRVKHGGSSFERDFSRTISDATVRYYDTDDESGVDVAAASFIRQGKSIHASVTVPHGSDVMASDAIELDDGLTYEIVGKPMSRANGLTGTNFRTRILLARMEA